MNFNRDNDPVNILARHLVRKREGFTINKRLFLAGIYETVAEGEDTYG
jgi:hypothetical protein